MAAAQWRKAMNSAAARDRALREAAPAAAPAGAPAAQGSTGFMWPRIAPRHLVVAFGLLALPFVASPFITFQVGAQSLVLGMIALSLSFLAGYGGMVSLAQMTVAGIAGYAMAVFGHSSSAEISLGWPWWLAVPIAITVATLASALIGWLSVRTEGIYTIMITLAIGVAFYYLVLQNYSVFNGFQGFQRVLAPTAFGIGWREPTAFYFLALFWALAGYFFVKYQIGRASCRERV